MAGKRAGRSHVMSLTQRIEQLETMVLVMQQAVFTPWNVGWSYPMEHQDEEPFAKKFKTDTREAPGILPVHDPTSADVSNSTPIREVRHQHEQSHGNQTESKENMLNSASFDFASVVRNVVAHHIFCKRCYKSAVKCECDVPLFSSNVCQSCGGTSCNCNAGCEDEIHSAGTAEECVICERLNIGDQCDMGCCSGQGCDAKAHCGCAGFDSVIAQEGAAWRCQRCIRDGVPQILSDSDSESEAGGRTRQRVYDLERCRMQLEDAIVRMSTCFSKDQVEEEIKKGTIATVQILTPQITAKVKAQVTETYESRIRELERELQEKEGRQVRRNKK